MTIYTVIPFFSDGIEIFQNDIKSFYDYDKAYHYATSYCSGRTFEIVKNNLE